MYRVTKARVESAVTALNDKAGELGMDRRFEFRPGNRATGVSHVLLECRDVEGNTLPVWVGETKIGGPLADALRYVEAMNHALLSLLADRDFRRASRHALPTYDRVERDNQTDEPEVVDPHNQAG
jgi:hypothetical protein